MQMTVPEALAIVGSVGALVWLIIRLSMRPIEQGLLRLEQGLEHLVTREEVERLVELRIAQHIQMCIDHKEKKEIWKTETNSMRKEL